MVFFHKEITVSAEIKQNSDWLKPCCPNGHTHFSAFKRGCSGLWASGQFVFFMDFVCVWSRSFLLANKVLLHSALKTPGDFFDLWNLLDEPRKEKLFIRLFGDHEGTNRGSALRVEGTTCIPAPRPPKIKGKQSLQYLPIWWLNAGLISVQR